MDNRRNYYRILHVQPDAPLEIIRSSYRTLMQRLKAHPDLGGDHWNAAVINEAYAVLTNEQQRAEYDQQFKSRFGNARVVDPVRDTTATARVFVGCFFCGAPRDSAQGLKLDSVCGSCRSPLYPAARRRLGEDSQRIMERLNRRYSLVVFTEWPQARGFPAESRDISLNGIRFVTAEPLAASETIKLDSEVCRAVARIVNVRDNRVENDGRLLVGAEFVSVLFPQPRGAFVSERA